MPEYYAHSFPGEKEPSERWQSLCEHLGRVAAEALKLGLVVQTTLPEFSETAEFAGWLHDLGKYRPEFLGMLLGTKQKGESTRHKQAGAAWAADERRRDIAFAIAGHHGGLPNSEDLKSLIEGPGGRDIAARVRTVAVAECPRLAQPLPKWSRQMTPTQFDVWVRLLFSCLVDADWLDTGFHERAARGQPPLPTPADLNAPLLDSLMANVRGYIETRSEECRKARDEAAVAADEINELSQSTERDVPTIRAEILAAAVSASENLPGLFSLTVPTGGGKTLAALSFALRHARQHGLRRVIYVAPYLSILEQNAREIRRALGANLDSANADLVFEHHSLAEPPGGKDADEAESSAIARQAENWSAPFIVTTNVQFFESLFSNQPGQCRKLHNIARSVVILDECQTLPPGVVAPTCSMLRDFVSMTGGTVVLCTATQPAWNARPGFEQGLHNVGEIATKELNLFHRLRRVAIRWPRKDDPHLDWPAVAARMLDEPAALCIVNTKRAAAAVFSHLIEHVGDDAFHLSTAMCPAHRLEVLDEVRRRLKEGIRCYLASTQLIEAGVDVDFPLVLRELAPLEAVVQAAGRCNREGLRNPPDGSPGGRVVVFRSAEGKLPRGDRWYQAGVDTVVNEFLNPGHEPDISQPEQMLEYFRRLYRTGQLDSREIEALRARQQFATIWHGDESIKNRGRYRIIDDESWSITVATWEPHRTEVDNLLAEAAHQPGRRVFRELSRFQVNFRIYELSQFGSWITTEANERRVWRGRYDERRGVVADFDDQLLGGV